MGHPGGGEKGLWSPQALATSPWAQIVDVSAPEHVQKVTPGTKTKAVTLIFWQFFGHSFQAQGHIVRHLEPRWHYGAVRDLTDKYCNEDVLVDPFFCSSSVRRQSFACPSTFCTLCIDSLGRPCLCSLWPGSCRRQRRLRF